MQVVLVAGLLLLCGMLGYWGWHRVRDQVHGDPAYLLDRDRLRYTPQPDWIPGNVADDVLRASNLEGPITLLDDGAAQRLAAAFTLHPWVASARVTKEFPAGATVELTYRKPVLLVRRAATTGPPLFVLDEQAVRVPVENMETSLQQRLPRMVTRELPPLLSQVTQDAKLLGAVDVARHLATVWTTLQLSEIVPSQRSGQDNRHVYELLTIHGDRVVWGTAPMRDGSPDELTGPERVARLQAHAAQHGSLRDPHGSGRLDVQTLPPPPSR